VLTRSLDWRCRAARHGSRARTHSGARCGGRFARWIASAVHRPNRAFAVGRPADGRGCTRDRPAVRHGPIDRRPTAGPSATRPVQTWPPTRRFCAKQAAAMILSFLASAGGPAICYSSGTLRRLSSNGRRHRFSSSRVSIAKAQIRNGPVRNGPNVDNSFACTIGL